jgi:hypothetical protein
MVGSANAGEITLSGLPINGGEIELNTNDGATVPAGIAAGSIVSVFALGNATPILTGTLKAK